jgi:hypothetical protein
MTREERRQYRMQLLEERRKQKQSFNTAQSRSVSASSSRKDIRIDNSIKKLTPKKGCGCHRSKG